MTSNRNLWDKFIKDKDGKVVIGQSPNLALLVFLVCLLVTSLVRTGLVSDSFKAVGFGAIFTWSWMELFSGVNYFRRLLGLGVMVISLVSLVSYLYYLKGYN